MVELWFASWRNNTHRSYVGILGIEAILIALASYALFGEQFTAREIAGGALIVAGTALAWS